ncbi:MAG: DHH family phosphoesterase [Oscillospiraceae bacterium]|nr:DHH family phosphoesterase [Oscillospiraceae bacterium]
MQQKFKLFTPIVIILMALVALLCAVIYFYDIQMFYLASAASLVVFAAALIMLRSLSARTRVLLGEIALGIQQSMEGVYSELPTPVLTVYGDGEIVWYNQICAARVFDGRDMRGEDAREIFPGVDLTVTSPPEGYNVEYGGRKYTAFAVATVLGEAPALIIYMIDDSRLKHFAREYHETRPSIALMAVDNYEALIQDYKDSERAQLMTEVEQTIEKYMSENHGFVTKLSRDKYIAFIETRGVRAIVADKFGLLDKVRGLAVGSRMPPTLSIGMAGDSESLFQADLAARQAMDMCLGRGGDQATVKTPVGYDFYGGMSKAIEKRTKVKTRIIAGALGELIESSANVLIMGHRFADLDCLGAALGMLKAVRSMGKQAHVCIDRERNLVMPLLDRLLAGEYRSDDFLSPEAAQVLVGPQTLLVVVDTHLPHVLESEPLYKSIRNVVVIDHHRKMVGHIENAAIFYHEPYASSTSEMVAEIIQYLPISPSISKLDAEALMAGIMLDTKNFMMRTGVRTFEAAAWLRRQGADTVEVRKLFASSMEAYRQRASFIAGAEIYCGCAIAASSQAFDDIKIVAPQAADELINISGVDASFVIYPYGGTINVSGRSMGTINVQLIMEKLGGGGHQTMAAAQFPESEYDTEAVRGKLVEAIDRYNADTSRPEPKTEPAEQKETEDTQAN